MPEMDGFDVLQIVKNDEVLTKIPVIVMSANDAPAVIAQCLQYGAIDFFVKPVRIQECKALALKMRQRQTMQTIAIESVEYQGLAKYKYKRGIGAGVNVYDNIVDNQEYAIKIIDLQYLTQKERQGAQSEIQFLKVLKGPTIIKFFESFIFKNKIYIVMEYACKGNLAQAIEVKKELKKTDPKAGFTSAQIMRYLAEITVAVMFMHNKHILHRDIKCHNIFISADGILKLGDFGISREIESTNAKLKTAAGTPYFMAPEVLKGIPYDSKADMWSVGVILYELITLKKPFDCDTVT